MALYVRWFWWLVLGALMVGAAWAEDGSAAWLRYPQVDNAARLAEYRAEVTEVVVRGNATMVVSAREELRRGLSGLLGRAIPARQAPTRSGTVLVEVHRRAGVPPEGFRVTSEAVGGRRAIRIVGGSDRGALYGAFALLRHMQQGLAVRNLRIEDHPRIPLRMVNEWANLDGSVERGYAGFSIFRWDDLPHTLSPRYEAYARLLASVGISAICVNNVNADPRILSREYIEKTAALARAFRPWGVRLFVAVNFKSPERVGGLKTSDPMDPAVRAWWKRTAEDVYRRIPDFGGWVIKADSEGQPGPYAYDRTHADGANMLAAALKPHGGIVYWRAFVYAMKSGDDRARMAFDAFHPLDGAFADNVILQVKNGPLDFQVREPVHPLFGAMPATNMAMEVQITQEYTGQSVHLCWLVPDWKRILDFDTHARGPGSSVRRVVDGSLFHQRRAGIIGVANVGSDANWMGHHLTVANLYGFGRLAWNPDLPAEEIAEEWTRQTFNNDPVALGTIVRMLLRSHAVYERYTTPFGLNVLHDAPTHFDPDPARRTYYHGANREGIGFDRTSATGSGYAAQYFPSVARQYEHTATTPDSLLLFFHHVPWTHRLHDGRTVLQGILEDHNRGVEEAEAFRAQWQALKGRIDDERHAAILAKFEAQASHAEKWRDVVNAYFRGLSKTDE